MDQWILLHTHSDGEGMDAYPTNLRPSCTSGEEVCEQLFVAHTAVILVTKLSSLLQQFPNPGQVRDALFRASLISAEEAGNSDPEED